MCLFLFVSNVRYDAFPKMTLTIYAAMATNVATVPIVASILFSLASMSFKTIQYLQKLVAEQEELAQEKEEIAENVESGIIARAKGQIADKLQSFQQKDLHLFAFVFSDFFVRSLPLMAILAAVGDHNKTIVGRICFDTFAIALVALMEFVGNKWMRNGTASNDEVVKTFMVSVVSSFYVLLCSLKGFIDDNFVAESVSFVRFVKVQIARGVLAVTLSLISIVLTVSTFGNGRSGLTCVFMGLFYIFLFINYRTMRWISKSELVAGTDEFESTEQNNYILMEPLE